ncbi:macrophage mannose receptor 1-like protein [Dinothrombium tinctorium]|uniref:Macrophage mannose receptor 1-like protein n=1 Tax=Dinothrombium tinctorium TaxID=1965070 RepID=A0A3S3R0B7_9ACAR|nr:macrophage mannose receptor 1-like protein [Dinothrombium tinctorium]RWS16640.1 macrophage mannose receptor 1-like protein [Dinothrombium tinctorium]
MVSIHSKEENDFIRKLLHPFSKYWLGGLQIAFQLPSFAWIDGTPFDFVNWAQNRPRLRSLPKEILSVDGYGFWYDDSVNYAHGQLCQKSRDKSNLEFDSMPSHYVHALTKLAIVSEEKFKMLRDIVNQLKGDLIRENISKRDFNETISALRRQLVDYLHSKDDSTAIKQVKREIDKYFQISNENISKTNLKLSKYVKNVIERFAILNQSIGNLNKEMNKIKNVETNYEFNIKLLTNNSIRQYNSLYTQIVHNNEEFRYKLMLLVVLAVLLLVGVAFLQVYSVIKMRRIATMVYTLGDNFSYQSESGVKDEVIEMKKPSTSKKL